LLKKQDKDGAKKRDALMTQNHTDKERNDDRFNDKKINVAFSVT
jgi:hypothetical protein